MRKHPGQSNHLKPYIFLLACLKHHCTRTCGDLSITFYTLRNRLFLWYRFRGLVGCLMQPFMLSCHINPISLSVMRSEYGNANLAESTPTLGILGGGQLGLFLAIDALRMDCAVKVFATTTDDPACAIVERARAFGFDVDASRITPPIIGDFADVALQDAFLNSVDAVLVEFENVPLDFIARIAKSGLPVSANADILRTAQHRHLEKQVADQLGIPTAPCQRIATKEDMRAAAGEEIYPAILKLDSGGYDGKGQVAVASHAELPAAWETLGQRPCLLEQRVQFVREVSMLAGRNAQGEIICFPPSLNAHRDGILRTSSPLFEARVAEQLAIYARAWAEHFQLTGIVCLEFFETKDGFLFNESAPRPHNSYHWTLDASPPNQFELAVCAILGESFSEIPEKLETNVIMTNFIGEPPESSAIEGLSSKLYDYGKSACKPGRKMGHENTILIVSDLKKEMKLYSYVGQTERGAEKENVTLNDRSNSMQLDA